MDTGTHIVMGIGLTALATQDPAMAGSFAATATTLVVGSLILSKKKIGQLNMIIQILLLVFSNVFTISNIGFFSYLIPLGIGNHLIHLSYLKEEISSSKLLIFIFVCLLWIIIGQYLFNKAINYVKEKGTLSLY